VLTLYYLNEQQVDQQYAQLFPDAPEVRETDTRSTGSIGGHAKAGALFKIVADLGAETSLARGAGERRSYRLQPAQKLVAIWDALREKGDIALLAEGLRVEPLPVGSAVVVDGIFNLVEGPSGVSLLRGNVSGFDVSIAFSRERVPHSVYDWLVLQDQGASINAYGIVSKATGTVLHVRPVAFGLGFRKHFHLER
jgi:hypothetical protein